MSDLKRWINTKVKGDEKLYVCPDGYNLFPARLSKRKVDGKVAIIAAPSGAAKRAVAKRVRRSS